ncbi:OadG family protein [Clostridium sp. KNHs214]|uniref:OadG family protein n=1 Tax=Clostridium sp. KNHs214 TaxID=1540257 RepID=UPI00055089E4|nr:OadG family protein [Clostridium sp. KNHs214]
MKTLSFVGSLEVTLFAMLVVFSVLIFIALIVKVESFLVNNTQNILRGKSDKKDLETDKKEKTIEKHQEEISVSSEDGDLEVVAAIMAALSSYMDVPAENLVIKNIKRVNGNGWKDSAIKSSLR